VIEMRSINSAIKVAMLAGMAAVLSTGPALASGENKAMNEKPKVEIKVEKNEVEKVMLQEKKAEEKLDKLRINRLGIHGIDLLLDEDILGEEALEDILGEVD
jgi:hypothetical protein